jgi:predicted TPR repeat methyltransferase
METAHTASRHDAYAADYDRQMQEYACYLPEVLFGLCFDAIQPGQQLLEAGIGSGLAGSLFAKAGLDVHGFDFSPAMLEVCRAKGFATELKLHDLLQIPWPYPTESFDHLVCCGVFHFIPELGAVFQEARRVLRAGGRLAFTSKAPKTPLDPAQKYHQHQVDGLDVFEHAAGYLQGLIRQAGFEQQKVMRSLVGPDPFDTWVLRKGSPETSLEQRRL